jgi:short-subunit dehydrogenase
MKAPIMLAANFPHAPAKPRELMAKRTLENKRAIITGASSGIGRELALQLVAAGAAVCISARREERLLKLQTQIQNLGGCCQVVAGDIADSHTRERLLATVLDRFGGLDLLINNAGIGAMGRFEEASPERLRRIFEVNFFAVAELTRIAIPALRQGVDPMIVNLSSVLGHRGAPLKSEYCASKFALHGFSDSLRAELADDRIDVLLVSPSTTESEFFESAIEDKTGKNWLRRGAMTPQWVANKTVRAIRKGRHEIILTFGGRLLVWLDRMLPTLANRILARFGN